MNRKILLLLIIALAVFALCAFLVSANNSTADISEEDSISNTESEISNENESSSDNKLSSDNSEIAIEEKDIDFKIGIRERHCYTGIPHQSLIINSYSEMRDFCRRIKHGSKTIEELQKYDEDYFRENSILIVTHTECSGSTSVQVDNVSKKGNKVWVGGRISSSGCGTCDIACWLFAIEVKKSDIKDAEEIKAWCNYKHEEYNTENESSSDNKSSSDNSEIAIEEKDIDFEIGFWDIHCETIEPDQSLIINSYSEMQNFYKIIKFKSQTIEDLKKYDEDYFRDNSILLITHTESSGSIYHQLDNVVKKGNQVLVYETVIYPSDGTCDMAYWLFAIEVKKSDINGAEDIDVICNCKPGNDKLIN